jgi:hypothetical protein
MTTTMASGISAQIFSIVLAKALDSFKHGSRTKTLCVIKRYPNLQTNLVAYFNQSLGYGLYRISSAILIISLLVERRFLLKLA